MSDNKYTNLLEVADATNDFLTSLGWDDGDEVIAIAMGRLDALRPKVQESILDRCPECTHLIYVLDCTDDEQGNPHSSNIMGQIFPCKVDENGTITLLEDIGECYGSGPSLQDVCPGRAIAWIGEHGVTDLHDVVDGWRTWPAVDHWYPQYPVDYSYKG